MHHRPGKLILPVREQIAFEPIDPGQRLPVEQLGGRIDRLVLDAGPKGSEGIVVLKRNAPRIDL